MNGQPDVLLTRIIERGDGVFGWMTVGTFAGFTVERPWLRNQKELSCIPRGTYRIALQFSPHFQRNLWHVLDVEGREAIEIHPGNRFTDLKGCVAPGDSIGRDAQGWFVANSRVTVEAFHAAMGDATEGTLTILDGDAPMTDLHHMATGPE
jgi:Family of unknown function (DUF5675)